MNLLLLICLIITAMALLFFAALFAVYRYTYGVNKRKSGDRFSVEDEETAAMPREKMAAVHKAWEIPAKNVYTTSFDGYRLHALYYENEKDAPFVLMFHGYKSGCLRDFASMIPEFWKLGMNVIAVDQRAHGKSEGRCLSFGVLERKDVLSWIGYIGETFGKERKITLMGLSMGAGTVLMASDMLPETVTGIIADCGYTTPKAIIRKVLKDMKRHVPTAYFMVRLSGKVFGGFDVESASAMEALRNCHKPVLFIHGEDDRFVPCGMSRENHAAYGGDKELYTVPGAGHGMAYIVNRTKYREVAGAFLERTNPVGKTPAAEN